MVSARVKAAFLVPAATVAAALLAAGCRREAPVAPPGDRAGYPGAMTGQADLKPLSGLVLIPARSQADKALGLQGVTTLPHGRGVIFFLAPDPAGRPALFHSRNCLFTIGMAAIDKRGFILELRNLPPESYAAFPPETAFIIETAADWFPEHGFRAGDRLDMHSVMAAIDETLNVRNHLERAAP